MTQTTYPLSPDLRETVNALFPVEPESQSDTPHENVQWRAHIKVEKRDGDWTAEQIARGEAPEPYEVVDVDGNLLTTLGANLLWTALIGSAITAYSNANSAMAVGDGTTAAAAGDTDLSAAAGTGKTITAATNASPISVTATAHGFTTGQLVVVTGVVGNTAANGTWIITVVDANTFTLTGSTGNGAYTSGGTATPYNKLRKGMAATYPQISTNTITFQSVFGTNDANFAWQEWGIFNAIATTGGTLLNHKVQNLGTKVSGSTWTATATISLA